MVTEIVPDSSCRRWKRCRHSRSRFGRCTWIRRWWSWNNNSDQSNEKLTGFDSMDTLRLCRICGIAWIPFCRPPRPRQHKKLKSSPGAIGAPHRIWPRHGHRLGRRNESVLRVRRVLPASACSGCKWKLRWAEWHHRPRDRNVSWHWAWRICPSRCCLWWGGPTFPGSCSVKVTNTWEGLILPGSKSMQK